MRRKKLGLKPLTMAECRKIESSLKKKVKALSPAKEQELKRYLDEGIERANKTGTPADAATSLRLIATWFAKEEIKKKKG